MNKLCQKCKGLGKFADEICPECNGYVWEEFVFESQKKYSDDKEDMEVEDE